MKLQENKLTFASFLALAVWTFGAPTPAYAFIDDDDKDKDKDDDEDDDG